MPILTRRKMIFIREETTAGTAIGVTAAHGSMVVSNVTFEPDIGQSERDILSPSLSRFGTIPGARAGMIRFRTEVKGGGAMSALTKPTTGFPAIDPALRCCGFARDGVAGTAASGGDPRVGAGFEYTPLTDEIPFVSAYVYNLDSTGPALVMGLAGAQGNVTFTGRIGEPMFAEFELKGLFINPVNVSSPPTPTFETRVPPVLLDTELSALGASLKIDSFSINMGNEVAMRSDMAQGSGYTGAIITGRSPSFTIDPEQTLTSEFDTYKFLRDASTAAFTFKWGTTEGNKVEFSSPAAQIMRVTEGDRNSIATFSVEGRFNRSAATGNDELKITFR